MTGRRASTLIVSWSDPTCSVTFLERALPRRQHELVSKRLSLARCLQDVAARPDGLELELAVPIVVAVH